MAGREECIYYYRQLLALLEEDRSSISYCVDGEIKEIYKNALMREIHALKEDMSALPPY